MTDTKAPARNLPPDPGPLHPDDLRRVLVLRTPPGPQTGLIPEAWFTPQEGRYIAGAFRIPGGRRVAVMVDPEIEPATFRIEDALTGVVVQTGTVGQRRPIPLPQVDIKDRIARMRPHEVR